MRLPVHVFASTPNRGGPLSPKTIDANTVAVADRVIRFLDQLEKIASRG